MLVLLACGLAVARRRALVVTQGAYRSFLLRPWKVATFVLLGAAITLPAPYLDYHSWDMPIGAGQATLSFLLAPWAVGALYRARTKRLEALLALCAALFASCWWVEGYLYLRDGSPMPDWLGNYVVSPPSFVAVGLLWNVERVGEGDYSLAFLRDDWPAPAEGA